MSIYILIFSNIWILDVHEIVAFDFYLLFIFNFGLIRWPPQPLREKVTKISKIVDF